MPDTNPFFELGLPEGRIPRDLVAEVNSRRLSLQFTDHERKSDVAIVQFDNRDRFLIDNAVFRKGTVVTLQFGYGSRVAPVRSMVVRDLGGWHPYQIELKNASILMSRDRISWHYEDVSTSDVVFEVARRNGFSDDYIHITETDDYHESINQVGESDAAFVARLGRKNGMVFYVSPDGFHWEPRDLGSRPLRRIRYGDRDGEPGDVVGLPHLKGVGGLMTAVVAASDGDESVARDGTTTLTGLAPVNELAEDRDVPTALNQPSSTAGAVVVVGSGLGGGTETLAGAQITAALDGDRPENRVFGLARDHDPDGRPERRARVRYERARGEAAKMRVTIVGDPLVSARSVIVCDGFSSAIDGAWFVKETIHRIGGGPYTTDLELRRDGYNARLLTDDSRYDLGAALGRVGRRSRTRGDDTFSVGGDQVKEALAALRRRAQLRASGAPLTRLTAFFSRVSTVEREWGQSGVTALPRVRIIAREGRTVGTEVGDPEMTRLAEELERAVAGIKPVEAKSEATLNQLQPIDDPDSLESSVVETTDSEGRPALAFRPRGARFER